MTAQPSTSPGEETEVVESAPRVGEMAWADAVLEGDRPARDSIVPPMFPSVPPDPVVVGEVTPNPSSQDVLPPFSVAPVPIAAEGALVAINAVTPFADSASGDLPPLVTALPTTSLPPTEFQLLDAPYEEAAVEPPFDWHAIPSSVPPPDPAPELLAEAPEAYHDAIAPAGGFTSPITGPDPLSEAIAGGFTSPIAGPDAFDAQAHADELSALHAQLDALTSVPAGSSIPEEALPIPEAVSAIPEAQQDDPAAVEAALMAAEAPSVELDPMELADPLDIVDLETLDSAFDSIFGYQNAATSIPGNTTDSPVISATTGELTHPPPPVTMRTDAVMATPTPMQQLTRQREVPQLPPKGEIILGIDLGTTYSCAAIVERRQASVLASRWGSPTIPSVVAFLPDGRTLVGESALRYGNDPRRVIAGSKRIFGRAYHSPIVQELREHFAYEIVEGADGDAAIRVDGRVIGLEEVATAILREIRESAGLQLEGRVNRAVITCPAHFSERQRDAVRYAGELAGFHVERVLSEPTAAAIHFGLGRSLSKRKVLVFDLGGGTFDVSLLEVNGDVFEVLGTGGDSFLGGIDFDACIADQIVEAFLEKEQIDARTDPVAIARILQYAERAKRELSDRSSTIVQIDHLSVQPHAARSLTIPIRRSRVEEMWSPLIEHTATIVQEVLDRAEVKPKEVDEVLLVGGQSRTPAVQKRMEQLFGRKLGRAINPEEAIALGAAQLGDTLGKASSTVTLIDVLPMSIGVGLPGGRYKRILERDTKLPAERSYSLRSTRDNQTKFEIVLFQGEDENVDNDDPLGVIELAGLPKGPKGSVSVVINLRVTAQQVLEIQARETKTGKSVVANFATKNTGEDVRRKMGLPGALSHEELKRRKTRRSRIKGVWSWLTSLFKKK